MAKYEVIGPLLVYGRRKGETFNHEFEPDQEAALIQAGHIRRKKDAPKQSPKPQKPASKPDAPQPPSGEAAQSSTSDKKEK